LGGEEKGQEKSLAIREEDPNPDEKARYNLLECRI